MDGTYRKRGDNLSTWPMCEERSHSQQRRDSDCGRSDIFLLCSSHAWHFPCWGENTDEWQAGSPCDLDHLGFKGLHMLQKRLHGLSCVDDGLREGKSKAWHEEGRDGDIWVQNEMCRSSGEKLLIFHVQKEISSFTVTVESSTVYWQESINTLCIK